MAENRFICDLPWTHLSIHPHGNCSICCVADHSNMQSTAANKDVHGNYTQIVKIGDGIENIINSDSYKDIRKQMINGERPAACSTCWKVEDAGGKSKRQKDSYLFPDVDNITKEDGSIELNLTNVEVRLGNYCNLKCRSCNAESSTSWIDDYYKLKDRVPLPSGYDKLKNSQHVSYDWVEDEGFYDNLIKNSPNMEQLHISGGEPFLVPKHFYLLDRLIEDDLAKNIKIFYITNANYKYEKIKPALEKLKKFHAVFISFSVDDIGDRNTYIRSLSNWELTIENIKKITTDFPNFHYTITQTINAYNFMYCEELSQFLLKEKIMRFENGGLVNHIITNHVHSPEYQNANVLPLDIRKKKIESIKGLVAPEFYNDILGRYYDAPENGEIELFKKVTYTVDEVRKESFSETFPKLFEIIK
jgi:MoaA/NifB/PqqE/SkfB family radical SAM enzyme